MKERFRFIDNFLIREKLLTIMTSFLLTNLALAATSSEKLTQNDSLAISVTAGDSRDIQAQRQIGAATTLKDETERLVETEIIADKEVTEIQTTVNTSLSIINQQVPLTVSDLIKETRIFLTRDEGVVRGEIILGKKTDIQSIPLSLESGEVIFSDSGKDADVKKGDGIFSAHFKLDVTKNTDKLIQQVKRNLAVLEGGSNEEFIKLGRRNIVPANTIVEKIKADKEGLVNKIELGKKLLEFTEFKSPLEGAKAINIDIEKVPFIKIPGPLTELKLPSQFVFNFPILPFFPFTAVPINQQKSLMITDIDIVEDPTRTYDSCTNTGTQGGAWSFGHIMREMSQGSSSSPEQFTLNWLNKWMTLQAPNGDLFNTTPTRANAMQNIINNWDGLDGTLDGNYDVNRFPARLLAIVNRPDLADSVGYGSSGSSAGEARFVFGILDGSCNVASFTAIFEYGIKANSCSTVKAWHQRWKNLDAHTSSSAAYKTALEAITRDFTDFGSQTPNQSALNQLRTNEVALSFPWQLLEFTLNGTGTGQLHPTTTKQTPRDDLHQTSRLEDYLVTNQVNILNGTHIVPEYFPISPPALAFLGAHSEPNSPNPVWNIPSSPNSLVDLNNLNGGLFLSSGDFSEVRRKFSLKTCDGCHSGETTTSFTHIKPRIMGVSSDLSHFLKGMNIPVPITGSLTGTVIHYDDLAEREQAMSDILTNFCFAISQPTSAFQLSH